ncbi:MAG: hypothetical protein WBG38_15500, partial [Nodosilinea sp.]
MGLVVERVQARLARFEFEPLFVSELGWVPGPPTGQLWPVDVLQNCRILAHCPTAGEPAVVAAAQGSGWDSLSFPDQMHRLRQIAQSLGHAIAIWRSSTGDRSLWVCSDADAETCPILSDLSGCAQAVIRGEAPQSWALLLAELAQPFPPPALPESDTLTRGFYQSWQTLTEALKAVSGDDRMAYATLLLARMIAIAALQQRGYLGGDEWYLQNQFGQSQQRGPNNFFQEVLQPLCQQGLTLPAEERTPALNQRLGPLPFVPTGPFRFAELDQRWGHLPLPDTAFEPALNWLADLLAASPSGLDLELATLLEQAVNGHNGAALATPEPLLRALCDRTIHATVLDRAKDLVGYSFDSTDHLLMAISPAQAGELLQELGQLT